MRRSLRFGRLLGAAVVAAWLVSPISLAWAQSGKPDPAARPGEKAPEEDKGPPRISVLRLQVIKPEPVAGNLPPGIQRRARFGFEAAPREGTSLTFALDEPSRLILGVETKDCKITRFRDDRGTDLTPDPAEPAGRGIAAVHRFGQDEGAISTEVDPTGHRLTVTVHSPRLPTGGANRLLLDTVLAVRFARGVKTFEQKNVNLKLDKFTAGPYSLVVMGQLDANGNVGQGGRTQVVLFHQGPLRDVNRVAFVGPDGEQIQAMTNGSGQNGSVHQTHYSLAKRVETCTIRLSAPETVETESMAVEINTGIGFPAGARRRVLPAPESRPTAADAPPR